MVAGELRRRHWSSSLTDGMGSSGGRTRATSVRNSGSGKRAIHSSTAAWRSDIVHHPLCVLDDGGPWVAPAVAVLAGTE